MIFLLKSFITIFLSVQGSKSIEKLIKSDKNYVSIIIKMIFFRNQTIVLSWT